MGYGIKNMLLPTENPKMQTMIDELNIEKEQELIIHIMKNIRLFILDGASKG